MKILAKVMEEIDFFHVDICYAALLTFGKQHLFNQIVTKQQLKISLFLSQRWELVQKTDFMSQSFHTLIYSQKQDKGRVCKNFQYSLMALPQRNGEVLHVQQLASVSKKLT